MEQVISEVKVIETDDGFRIEIKGDKEKIVMVPKIWTLIQAFLGGSLL
jgi:hypothetical protein